MEINYFKETDTLLVNFCDKRIDDTCDISEDILVERDAIGNLVSMTLEHASQKANMKGFMFQEFINPIR